MKTKIFYVFLAVIIIIAVLMIIISVFVSRGTEEIKQLQQKEEQQESEFMPQAPTEPPVFFNKPILTRVKPVPKKPLPEEEPIASPEQAETAIDEKQTATRTLSSSTGSASIQTEPDEFSQEPLTPGLTRVPKYPTPEEKKDMDAKGIIMY
jgi:hypothetical protein